ncbi:hypothetical protein [Pseudomarimonas arenosa]|uniref:TonB C-terminal domain-containing protein n=1 Tax=Pseudomarimonas arenosa TaxID=2774145 RepID=A0AAW3ZJV2_9GAMM|nr:hypothetical protein [Pseudomarimonas arenosa]MBD8525447.1 hypothetical protein [Pseudomarimonas arenosa]
MPFRHHRFPLLAAAVLAAGSTWANEHLLLIDAEVTVAADGTVSEARLSGPQLPQAIATAALDNIHNLHFKPIEVNGAAATVTSQLRFHTCLRASEQAAALQFAMQLKAIGPQRIDRAPPPITPALLHGAERTELNIKFAVNPDGSASFHGLDMDPARLGRRDRAAVEKQYRRWIESARYTPERVNGLPVATHMEWPITVTVSRSLSPPEPESVQTACDLAEPADSAPRVAGEQARLRLLSEAG